jgi:hypothetical protein
MGLVARWFEPTWLYVPEKLAIGEAGQQQCDGDAQSIAKAPRKILQTQRSQRKADCSGGCYSCNSYADKTYH